MTTLLFWNVGAASRPKQIVDLASRFEADVILLAEANDEPKELETALQRTGAIYHHAPGVANTKLHVFVRFSETFARPIYETDRLTVRRINPPDVQEILVAAVHFPGKLDWSEDSQALECTRLAQDIQTAEKNAGHQDTVLVGDLNMNPFETGIVSAAGIHAVMDRRIAEREARVVQGRRYPFFYNPMWGLFGDGTRGPAGTFYHPRSEHKVYFWNMFDQVLIRPSLLNRFQMDDLAIITHTGVHSLLKESGIPDREVGSDHLPILFKLS